MSEARVIKHKPAAAKAKSKKRRRDDDGGSRKRRKLAAYEEDEEYLDLEAGVNKKIASIDNLLLADHISKKIRRFGTDLNPVELSQLDISPNSITDTTSFLKIRTLENLPEFLETFTEPEKFGKGERLTAHHHRHRCRSVRKYQSKTNSIAKLFAKHIKVEESVQFLEKHRTGIAVGTPVRLSDLVDNSALKLDKLERLVVDASHIDQKKRGVMDMKETMMPLARWLARQEFKERYGDEEKGLQLLFY
ncbi:U3-containing 90S pre-ribosomal complex subunit-domain containing protein [Hypoxylon sp. NC1633]|nr:U3-containing 90S pre-ribosomal complex subunit-domain containing protein [Hypoxylon sp. NC1633]